MRKIAFTLIIVLLASSAFSEDWPAGWSFRVHVTPAEQAPDYELWLDHHGLAQPDARDVRVFAAEAQPVSHFVAYADDTRARIIFDGAAGLRAYTVYLGNLAP